MELKSTRASNLIPFAEVPRNFYGGRPRANRYVSVGSIFDLCCWTLSDAPPLLIVREIQTFVEDLDAQGVGAPSVQLRGATPRNAETLGRERAPPPPPHPWPRLWTKENKHPNFIWMFPCQDAHRWVPYAFSRPQFARRKVAHLIQYPVAVSFLFMISLKH